MGKKKIKMGKGAGLHPKKGFGFLLCTRNENAGQYGDLGKQR